MVGRQRERSTDRQTDRHRQTDRQIDRHRHTDRGTDRHTDTQTDRQTDGQRKAAQTAQWSVIIALFTLDGSARSLACYR